MVKMKLSLGRCLLNFLNPTCFPDDILIALSRFLINPRASTYSDYNLTMVLKKYDKCNSKFIVDLEQGDIFKISSGKIFVKGKLAEKD